MTIEQLTEALDNANIPFTIRTRHKEVYIEGTLIINNDSAFVKPEKDLGFFNTAWNNSIPLKSLKLKDIQPMIKHYRKCHPASPEISSDKGNEKHFHRTITVKGGTYARQSNSQTSRKKSRQGTPAPEEGAGNQAGESKKILVKQRLEWSVNTPDLLKDIIPNMRASESISPSIITIFGSLLAEVAKRAIELHDPKLDSLMLRLNLYECDGADGDAKNKWRVKMIDKLEKMAKEA